PPMSIPYELITPLDPANTAHSYPPAHIERGAAQILVRPSEGAHHGQIVHPPTTSRAPPTPPASAKSGQISRHADRRSYAHSWRNSSSSEVNARRPSSLSPST